MVEAQLLVDRLRQEGIVTYLRNEALQGALGELPVSLHPEVCVVHHADAGRALQIVVAFELAQHAAQVEPRFCGGCDEHSPGNFEVCWKCRQPFESAVG